MPLLQEPKLNDHPHSSLEPFTLREVDPPPNDRVLQQLWLVLARAQKMGTGLLQSIHSIFPH